MSVGIYMPAFNVEKYISESIQSIKKQTYSDWELVIIDDCSSDKTYEKAMEFSCGRLRVYKSDHHYGKIGLLKNECIAQLDPQHEYICHVGSDDVIPPYCLKTFVDFMDKHPEIGVCCGNFKCFDDSGREWSFPHVANSGDFDSNILLRYMCLFPHRFYRKSIIEKVGGYSNELSSAVDYDLALRLDESGIKIRRIKEPITYYYRQHSQQISTRARPEQDLNAKKALQNALDRRGINGVVTNNAPPFIIEYLSQPEEEHFIWGAKK